MSDGAVKPCNTYKNLDLSFGSHSDNLWEGTFVLTLLEYMGTLNDPWTISDADLVKVLQMIWDEIYAGRIEHKMKVGDCVHALVSLLLHRIVLATHYLPAGDTTHL